MNFLDFLNTGGMFEAKTDGVKAYYFVEGEHEAREYHYSYDDIASVDPRLVVVLKQVFIEVAHPTIPIQSIFAHWVKSTLEHWENPKLIKTLEGETHFIKDVTGVRFTDMESRAIAMSVLAYSPKIVGDVEYVMHVVPRTLSMSFDELDKVFPGWEQRYVLFQAIGSFVNDELQAIFPNNTAAATNVSDMTGVNFQ